jgi:hypothetical protein
MVTGSPVALGATGVAAVAAATQGPSTWIPSQTRYSRSTVCSLIDPAQAFTLTNTGNVNLTGIAQGALVGAIANELIAGRFVLNLRTGTAN